LAEAFPPGRQPLPGEEHRARLARRQQAVPSRLAERWIVQVLAETSLAFASGEQRLGHESLPWEWSGGGNRRACFQFHANGSERAEQSAASRRRRRVPGAHRSTLPARRPSRSFRTAWHALG